MNASRLLVSPSHIRAALGLANAVAYWDECASLIAEPGIGTTALLSQVERELSSRGVQCIRIYGSLSGELAVRDIIAQLVGRADPGALTDDDLKAGFVALTEPHEGHDRLALLVTEAHSLLPSALRYIQLACQSSPKPRVVLAGEPGLAVTLAADEFAPLRHRITRSFALPEPVADSPPELSAAAPEPRPTPGARRRNIPWTLVRLGLAGAVAAVVLTTRWNHVRTPPPATVQMNAPNSAAPAMLAHTEATTPVMVTPPEAAGPVAAERRRPDAVQERTEEFPPYRQGQAVTMAVVPPPEQVAPPVEDRPEPSGTGTPAPDAPTPDVPAAPASLDVPATPEAPTERDASVATEPLVPTTPERVAEPVQSAEPAVAQAPEPVATQAPDPAPPLGNPGASPDLPALPLPPPPQAPAAAPPLPVAQQAARRERGGTERAATPVAAPPVRLTDERRCRDIAMKFQLGQEPSDADKQFLRSGCRAR